MVPASAVRLSAINPYALNHNRTIIRAFPAGGNNSRAGQFKIVERKVMPVRLGRFEMPKRLTKEEATATETYAKFIAEPFEPGYGHTVGNSLRRVLLSSLEGAAITSVKIDGAMHEFTTIDGVVEDVTDIVLNLKRIKFKAHTREQQTLMLSAHKEGPV